MGDVTAHFDYREFTCKCGCSTNRMDRKFIEKMETIFDYLSKTADGVSVIIINSGYRCTKSSNSSPGAFVGDTHNLGFGADFHAVKADGETPWSSYALAAVCEHLGFTGIGIITDIDVHADTRTINNYPNGHWFGNEMTGNDNIKSFLEYLPPIKVTAAEKHKITVFYDGKLLYECEV